MNWAESSGFEQATGTYESTSRCIETFQETIAFKFVSLKEITK